jgi:2-dehydro-3-deoxyphosphooctonate aldolase (KDO 8-P synthase)
LSERIFIAGPCVLESEESAFEAAGMLRGIFSAHTEVKWFFKASFLKDNRTSASSFRGPGLDRGIEILASVRREFGIPVTTDVHEPGQIAAVAGSVDLLQIPAFLCRQTSLLEAAGESGIPVNVKKGQFMNPRNMAGAVEKLRARGCPRVLLTERGAFFGYGDLVVDFRSLSIMADLCDAVLLDVTHSLQKPGALGGESGGDRSHALRLARAAAAWGIDGLFFEAHPRPAESPSDRETILDATGSAALVEASLRHWEGTG